jgi:hypothetical protein
MWVQSNGANGFGTVIGGYGSADGMWLDLRSPDQLLVWSCCGHLTFSMGRSLNDGLWHQVAITYAGGLMTAYADGAAFGALSVTLNTVDSNCGTGLALMFGGAPCTANAYNAYLDEVAVYDHALTASQIAAHFNAALSTPPTPARLRLTPNARPNFA